MKSIAKTEGPDRGKKQKRIDISEAANGFVLNRHEYEYDYGSKPQIYRSAKEVAEAVEKFLGE